MFANIEFDLEEQVDLVLNLDLSFFFTVQDCIIRMHSIQNAFFLQSWFQHLRLTYSVFRSPRELIYSVSRSSRELMYSISRFLRELIYSLSRFPRELIYSVSRSPRGLIHSVLRSPRELIYSV